MLWILFLIHALNIIPWSLSDSTITSMYHWSIFLRMNGRNCLKFGTMYPDYLQNWLDFGHVLLIWGQFLPCEMRQMLCFRLLFWEQLEGIATIVGDAVTGLISFIKRDKVLSRMDQRHTSNNSILCNMICNVNFSVKLNRTENVEI